MEKIDHIFRKYYDDWLRSAALICLRENKDEEELSLLDSIFSEEGIRRMRRLAGLGEIQESEIKQALSACHKSRVPREWNNAAEACLRDSLKRLCLSEKGMSKLTYRDIKKWPVFTNIMLELYKYLKTFYLRRAYDRDINTYLDVDVEDMDIEALDRHYERRQELFKNGQETEYVMFPTELCQVILGLLKEYYPSIFKHYRPDNVRGRLHKAFFARAIN